jgi:CcmD family protein
MKNKLALILLFLIIQTNIAFSENTTLPVEDDFFNQIGKIYVVVGVILLIFLGIVIYMVRLDRKISALENEMKNSDLKQV